MNLIENIRRFSSLVVQIRQQDDLLNMQHFLGNTSIHFISVCSIEAFVRFSPIMRNESRTPRARLAPLGNSVQIDGGSTTSTLITERKAEAKPQNIRKMRCSAPWSGKAAKENRKLLFWWFLEVIYSNALYFCDIFI